MSNPDPFHPSTYLSTDIFNDDDLSQTKQLMLSNFQKSPKYDFSYKYDLQNKRQDDNDFNDLMIT